MFDVGVVREPEREVQACTGFDPFAVEFQMCVADTSAVGAADVYPCVGFYVGFGRVADVDEAVFEDDAVYRVTFA